MAATTVPLFSDGQPDTNTAAPEPARKAVYGYTDNGAATHMLADPVTRLAACGRYLSYIPLKQPVDPDVCRLCVKHGDPTALANVAMPDRQQVEERTGPCCHCGGDTPLDSRGNTIPHGEVWMRKGGMERTPVPCRGAGKPPEADR